LAKDFARKGEYSFAIALKGTTRDGIELIA
jgi:hypothetical protein